MGYTLREVFELRRLSMSGSSSPSLLLIKHFGTFGSTVDELCYFLSQLRLKKVMEILLPYAEKETVQLYNSLDAVGRTNSQAAKDTWDDEESLELGSLESNTPVFCGNVTPSTSQTGAIGRSRANQGVILQSALVIPYADLSDATKGFSSANVVGKGGYGIVYKGLWKYTDVAVKRLISRGKRSSMSKIKDQTEQSLAELRALSLYRHENVLPLYGYCLDGPEPCLVYQYMTNGSLCDRLHRKNDTEIIATKARLDILRGASRGINFLHTCSDTPLIHGDIKSANLLLDDHFNVKIGDFGLAKKGGLELVPLDGADGGSAFIASHVKGTLAYLPRDFLKNKRVSTKLDVYSFGVVICEVATNERPYLESSNQYLADFLMGDQNGESLMKLEYCQANTHFSQKLTQIAFKCLSEKSVLRPAMTKVFDDLKNIEL